MLESAPDNCSIELPYIHREFVVGPNESNVDRSAVTGSLEAVRFCDVGQSVGGGGSEVSVRFPSLLPCVQVQCANTGVGCPFRRPSLYDLPTL
jgi:hypothetical protein